MRDVDKTRFTKLVEGGQASLRLFLLALCCGNGVEADDIAQMTYLKAWMAENVPTDEKQFAAWMHKAAYRTFLDQCRKRHRQEELAAADTIPADCGNEADAAFRHQGLHIALAALPEAERSAILLFHLQGYTTQEIAHITESSEEAVRKRLSRARMHLKTLIRL